MPISIKDPAAERFVRELAAAAGESVTTAVRRAAEERLQRVRRQQAGRSLAAEILKIGSGARRCPISRRARRTSFSATTSMDCRADGNRQLGDHCRAAERG